MNDEIYRFGPWKWVILDISWHWLVSRIFRGRGTDLAQQGGRLWARTASCYWWGRKLYMSFADEFSNLRPIQRDYPIFMRCKFPSVSLKKPLQCMLSLGTELLFLLTSQDNVNVSIFWVDPGIKFIFSLLFYTSEFPPLKAIVSKPIYYTLLLL